MYFFKTIFFNLDEAAVTAIAVLTLCSYNIVTHYYAVTYLVSGKGDGQRREPN